MPVGSFVRRRVESGFKPQKRDRYSLAYDWLEWLNHSGQYMITHKLNSGKEFYEFMSAFNTNILLG